MSDLSAGSKDWWLLLTTEARATYDRWAQAPAFEWAGIQPNPSEELRSSKYTRLESRRTLSCLAALFLILKNYQPGGLQERSRLIEALCGPGSGSSPRDVVEKLRTWSGRYTRAAAMAYERDRCPQCWAT